MARLLFIPKRLNAFLLFLAAWRAIAQPVINEIHYDPPEKTEPAEFVELFNPGSAAIRIGGWRLDGGVGFVFPPDTVIPAQGYLVVAQNPSFLRQKFGADALGPWTGRLRNDNERVELRDAAGELVDRVGFQLGFPWPTVGEAPGYSIELIHPSLDNELGGNWRASVAGGTFVGARRTLIDALGEWRYFRGLSEPSAPTTAWREEDFDDASWTLGAMPIGYDPSLALGTSLDDMRNRYTSVFLRHVFDVQDPAQVTSLELQALYDDGFKVWINGQHLIDVNIAAGELPFDATAGPARESNDYETFELPLPPGLLRATGNVVALQVHNSSLSASSDFFFDARLDAVSGPSGRGPTPGRLNIVFATNAPPAVRQVAHSPEQPGSSQPVVVSARITDPDGVSEVSLRYQVVEPGSYIELTDPEYETRWTSLPMRDDGTAGDDVAADGTFSATVPANVQRHRVLVRYRIEARDGGGRTVQVPYPDDPQPNFAYFVHDGVPAWTGAVRPGDAGALGQTFTVSSNEMNRLPVVYLLAKRSTVEESTWFSRYGGDAYLWGGTLVFNGRVYDHVRHRARGGVWRYAMTKNMWKFDFNRGHDFEAVDDWGRPLDARWTKLNLGASIQQGDFNHRGEQGMFESVGFRVFQLAGVPAMHSAYAQFRVIDDADEAPDGNQYNGDFWGLYLMLEQPDGRFLEQHGLPDGNLYKMEGGGGELNNLGPAGPADSSDLSNFLQRYNGASEAWWHQNFDVTNYLSYQSVVQAIHHYDICYDKNFFYYLHPETRRWQLIPWDLDLTWAENMYDAGCGGVDRIKERLLSNSGQFPATWRAWQNRIREFRDLFWNEDEAWRLIDEQAGRLRGPATGPTILDADRAQWDYNPRMTDGTYSTSPGSKAGWGRFYKWPNYPATVASRDFDGCLELMKRYVGFRATNSAARALDLDVIAADPSIPRRPVLVHAGATNFPVNALRFRCSPYQGSAPFAAQRWRIGEITRPDSPSWTAEKPWKYEIEPVWESGDRTAYDAEITVPAGALRVGSRYRARVQFADASGRASQWSEPVEFLAGAPDNTAALAVSLQLTELMFHAPGGTTNDFLELHNGGAAPMQLGGLTFTSGIDYVFPSGTTLAPGGYLVLTKASPAGNFAGFRAYYGLDSSVPIYGPYDGNLSDSGEHLVLASAAGADELLSVTYSDGRGWPIAADGAGHSLVPRRDFGGATRGALDFGGNWRASAFIRGSPGRADPEPDSTVVLNEVVAHTDFLSEFDSNDWVELYNRGDAPITLGDGWYLSDDSDDLRSWEIPAGTVLPAHGFVSFDEVTGFNHPRGAGFSLNKAGETVFLSHFPTGSPGRVVDAVSFKGQENEWALARVPDGGSYWDAVIPRTRDAANAAVLPRVVIDEFLYHEGGLPTNLVSADKLEFIEIHNSSAAPVPLYNPQGTWRLNGGVGFSFLPPTILAARERLLVVSFDPAHEPAALAGFRATLDVASGTRILGPYTGRLDNDTDRIALERPQAPDLPGEDISWVIVDEVDYHDSSPWPGGADGEGQSYQRLSPTVPGNDPSNWRAAPPTPGSASDAVSDRDGDGMPDSWETEYGLNPNDPGDANTDADADGASNLDEYHAGTHPKDASSALRLTGISGDSTGSVEFQFRSAPGRAYVVEGSTMPGERPWVTEQEIPPQTGAADVHVQLQLESGTASRFFRVRVR